MAEIDVVIDKKRLTYEGIFKVRDLYNMIDQWFEDKNYDKREILNVEVVKPEGKFIEIEMQPWKKVTDYANRLIYLRILMHDVKEVDIEKDGKTVRMNQGKIQIIFDAYLKTDYEDRWEMLPVYFFLRTIWNKYIYQPFTKGFKAGVKKDCIELYNNIRAFLNMYRTYGSTESLGDELEIGHHKGG